MLNNNRSNDLLLNARKKWIPLICFGYMMTFLLLAPAIITNNKFENIVSVVWISLFYTYVLLKCIHMIFFEIKEKSIDIRRYINFCEYVLFVTGVIIIFTFDHTGPKTIESLIFVTILMWGLFVCIFLLLLFCAIIYGCCGHNIHLKDFVLNIFEYEIVILQYIVLLMIMYSTSSGDDCEYENDYYAKKLLQTKDFTSQTNYDSLTDSDDTSPENVHK
jgi:hypothetical protein